MSAIFISHSHSDNAAADDCKRKLATQGHHSVFLDFDPAAIPAGRNWEKELYAALRACQAVIVLCSPQALASPWCFAEITQARALGKPVFPLLLADGTLPPLLSKVQAIDLTRAPEDGWRRLWAGLRLAGLDPTDPFDWDGTRPPYPGFLAFQEKDAAVYFGRDAAIHVTLETLNRLQRLGGARLLIVLGASGSGKSSLMRAGVLPRLKRDAERWLVVGPFRPLTRPVDECALALADAYAAAGDAHDWRALRDTLRSATQAGDAESLVDLAYDLRIAAGRREAGILLVVDQFEELLGHNAGQSADLFCRLLTQVLRAPDCPLLAAITLRSDFLGSLQTRPHLQELPYEAIHLAPMPLADFTQVIEGPARIAGVELGAGLTQAMVADAATDDALPLLAFTLRELWDHHGGDGRLTLEEYCDRLGGLKASVGRAAEGIFAAAGARAEAQLHRAFLSMVRVDEDGRYIRKPARWVDLPEDTHALLERYVQARLLVARGDGQARVLEVAHDALFRSWDRLAAWLNLDREFLLWRSRLQVAVGDWARTAHSDGSLLRGPLLDEALRWLGERVADLDRVSVEFIEASRRHEAGEQQRWKELYSKALSRQLAAQAMAEADPRLGLLLCGAALERSHTREAQYNLLELLHKTHYLQTSLYGHAATTSCVAFSPRGDLLASGSHDGDIVLWNLTADPVARQATLRGGHPLVSLDFSPDGRLLAAGGYYVDDAESRGCVWVWDVATGNAVTPAPQVLAGLVSAVRYSPDGSTLAVACWDGAVYYCDPHSGTGAAAAFTQEGSVSALAFSPDGTTLATIAGKIKLVGRLQLENWVSLWERASGQRRLAPLRGHNGGVTCLAYSQDGKVLLSGGNDGKVTLWDAGTGATMQEAAPAPLAQHGISSIALAPDGGSMATGSEDGSIVLWNLQSGTCDLLQAHQQAVMQLAFSPDGRTLASAGTDQSVILWNRTAGVPDGALQRVHDAAVVGLTFDASGSVLAAGDARGVVAFWPFQLGAPLYKSAQSAAGRLWALVFTPDLQLAASAGLDEKLIHLWNPTTGEAKCAPLAFEAMIPTLVFNADASLLAYVSGQPLPAEGNSHIVLWDVARGEMRAQLDCAPYGLVICLAFAAQRGVLAAGTWGGDVLLWDLENGTRCVQALYNHGESVLAVALNRNASLLASGSGQWFGQGKNTLALWDVLRGCYRQAPFKAHANNVSALAFSPDGTRLASASGSIHSSAGGADMRLWDAASGLALSPPLAAHPEMVRCLCFAPHGRLLASGGNDGSVRFWHVDPEDWMTVAVTRAGRGLSAAEMALYMPDEAPSPNGRAGT